MTHIDTCGANLCAEAPGNALRGWYPSEAICTAHGAAELRWNRNQRKIAKIHAKRPVEGFFTFAMLDGTFTVGKGIRGIDDERQRRTAEAAWIADHHWTPEQVARAAAQGAALFAKQATVGHSSGRNAADDGEGLVRGPFAVGAVELAAHGLRVLPVRLGTKQPAICDWPRTATSDPGKVARLAARHGAGNVAVATGGEIVVLDLDVKAGADGRATLAALERQHGPLPQTVTVATPTGGEHLYFRVPADCRVRNSASKLGPGIDVRGAGGLVVAPPSIHPNGSVYAWQEGRALGQVPIASLPDAWLDLLRPDASDVVVGTPQSAGGSTSRYGAVAVVAEAAKVAATPEGGRNPALVRGAFKLGQLVEAGHVAEGDALAAMDSAASRAGLTDPQERLTTVRSGLQAGRRHPRPVPPARGTCPVPAVTVATLDAVQPTWQRGLQLREGDGGHVVVDGAGKVLPGLDLPTLGLDADLVASIGRGMSRLGNVVGFRVLHWEVCKAHRQWLAGLREFHRLEVEGGWSGFAELLGVPSAADDVRDVVIAQAHLRFRFAHGERGNLLQYSEPVPEARNRRAVLVLSLGDPLLPGYVGKLPAGRTGQRQMRNRWLVPFLAELPRLDALPRTLQAAGVRLHWLFLRALASQPAALDAHGGVVLSGADWLRLATDAGVPVDYLPGLLRSWQDADMYPAFLSQPECGMWTLGPEHSAAVAFIRDRVALARDRRRRAGSSR